MKSIPCVRGECRERMASGETAVDGVIDPVEQKLVALTPGGDDEVLAARIESSEIYLPVKPICGALGVSCQHLAQKSEGLTGREQ